LTESSTIANISATVRCQGGEGAIGCQGGEGAIGCQGGEGAIEAPTEWSFEPALAKRVARPFEVDRSPKEAWIKKALTGASRRAHS
jgi:hypothetical protein